MNQLLPELTSEFAYLSDQVALQAETDELRDHLTVATNQLALERTLAWEVHRARHLAISRSPALRSVFGIEDADTLRTKNIDMSKVLSSAFVREVSVGELPEGFAAIVARSLRTSNHPDVGGDIRAAQDIEHGLARLTEDPTFSVASAILAAPKQAGGNPRALRVERYRLHLALAGTRPQFENAEEARNNAEIEINGAEWRVRTQAALKSFELIIGDAETWNRFLRELVRERHMPLINMVNRLQPRILRAQERLIKGDPLPTEALDIAAIDAIFQKIWSTLGAKDRSIPYSPPYQNWLEILLPAMELLDPGEKPGQKYTHFTPPIQLISTPSFYGYGGYDREPKSSLWNQDRYVRSNEEQGYY